MTIDRKTILSLFVFVLLLAMSYWGSTVYRPYIYSNHLFDYHLADTIPSLFCVPVAYSLGVFLSHLFNKPLADKFKPILYCALGFYCYEFLELFTGGFDWFDCIAIAIGTLLIVLTVKLFETKAL